MPAPKSFAIWDRRPWLGNSTLSIEVTEPTDLRELRRWHRTKLYDEAAAALDSNRSLPASPEGIHDDYTARLSRLSRGANEQLPVNKDPLALRLRRGDRRSIIMVTSMLGLIVAATAFTATTWRDVIPALIPFLFIAVTVLFTPLEQQQKESEERPGRHASLLLSRLCADCGYDLNGAPPGLPHDLIGLDVGPRTCPECGAPWPLVPPSPTPATGVYPGPTPAAVSFPQS